MYMSFNSLTVLRRKDSFRREKLSICWDYANGYDT
jgi:hypothetical protein